MILSPIWWFLKWSLLILVPLVFAVPAPTQKTVWATRKLAWTLQQAASWWRKLSPWRSPRSAMAACPRWGHLQPCFTQSLQVIRTLCWSLQQTEWALSSRLVFYCSAHFHYYCLFCSLCVTCGIAPWNKLPCLSICRLYLACAVAVWNSCYVSVHSQAVSSMRRCTMLLTNCHVCPFTGCKWLVRLLCGTIAVSLSIHRLCLTCGVAL